MTQALAYGAIVWNSGNLAAFTLSREDADVLIPWLTLNGFGESGLYLSGNGLTHGVNAEAVWEPSALTLLNVWCGVSHTCDTVREVNCPPGTPRTPRRAFPSIRRRRRRSLATRPGR